MKTDAKTTLEGKPADALRERLKQLEHFLRCEEKRFFELEFKLIRAERRKLACEIRLQASVDAVCIDRLENAGEDILHKAKFDVLCKESELINAKHEVRSCEVSLKVSKNCLKKLESDIDALKGGV